MLVVQSLKNQNPVQSEPRADPDAFIGLWMCVRMLARKYLDVEKSAYADETYCIKPFKRLSTQMALYKNQSHIWSFQNPIHRLYSFFKYWLCVLSSYNNDIKIIFLCCHDKSYITHVL